jgi:DNA end-binding protein Ku
VKEPGKQEMQMAKALIESMSDKWNPEQYVDEYRNALEKVIEEKIEKGDKAPSKPARKVKPTNVIDLVSVLQKSLEGAGGGKKKSSRATPKSSRATPKARRKAA